jgi:hypothetical protein
MILFSMRSLPLAVLWLSCASATQNIKLELHPAFENEEEAAKPCSDYVLADLRGNLTQWIQDARASYYERYGGVGTADISETTFKLSENEEERRDMGETTIFTGDLERDLQNMQCFANCDKYAAWPAFCYVGCYVCNPCACPSNMLHECGDENSSRARTLLRGLEGTVTTNNDIEANLTDNDIQLFEEFMSAYLNSVIYYWDSALPAEDRECLGTPGGELLFVKLMFST